MKTFFIAALVNVAVSTIYNPFPTPVNKLLSTFIGEKNYFAFHGKAGQVVQNMAAPSVMFREEPDSTISRPEYVLTFKDPAKPYKHVYFVHFRFDESVKVPKEETRFDDPHAVLFEAVKKDVLMRITRKKGHDYEDLQLEEMVELLQDRPADKVVEGKSG